MKDANNNITTLNKDNEKNKIKLEEGDSKRIALENEKCDLKKQLQNSRDQLKRAQSDEVAITWFFKWIYLFTYTGVQWYFHIIWCSSCK